MVTATVLVACCDVIALQNGRRRCLLLFLFCNAIVVVLASGFQLPQNITRGEEFLEQVLPESDELHILVIWTRDGEGI